MASFLNKLKGPKKLAILAWPKWHEWQDFQTKKIEVEKKKFGHFLYRGNTKSLANFLVGANSAPIQKIAKPMN